MKIHVGVGLDGGEAVLDPQLELPRRLVEVADEGDPSIDDAVERLAGRLFWNGVSP